MQPINIVSVKVMRSYDYCHFEVCLSMSGAEVTSFTTGDADDLRKEAARLADKAVAQYKIAKHNAEQIMKHDLHLERLRYQRDCALKTQESERTEQEKAVIKAFEDQRHSRYASYDYEDDWDVPDFEDDQEF